MDQKQITDRREALLARMTLAQQIGPMTQPDRACITPQQVKSHHIGSALRGDTPYAPLFRTALAAHSSTHDR